MEPQVKTFKTSQKVRDDVSRYQKEHKEAVRAKSQRAYYKMKQDPVRYQQYKDRRKLYVQSLKQKKEELVKELEKELIENKILV